MASLGQLVANVAHEINTPIGAVKASGKNISDALDETLKNLPRLFQILDHSMQDLFIQLITHARSINGILNTREERGIIRQVIEQLNHFQVEHPAYAAGVIVQLRAHPLIEKYLPLLQHQECKFILATAAGIAAIISSAENINTAVDQVAKIVFALKSYSRIDGSGEMRKANLKESLETVLMIYNNKIKQGTEVIRQYTFDEPILCLPDELNQVWTNLIHNAIQSMHYQGTLTVSIERIQEFAVVAIGDSGCGIPESIRNKIFDAFFTTKPAGEGSGLGLDIVKKIIENIMENRS